MVDIVIVMRSMMIVLGVANSTKESGTVLVIDRQIRIMLYAFVNIFDLMDQLEHLQLF